jgi:hypothetical protein
MQVAMACAAKSSSSSTPLRASSMSRDLDNRNAMGRGSLRAAARERPLGHRNLPLPAEEYLLQLEQGTGFKGILATTRPRS